MMLAYLLEDAIERKFIKVDPEVLEVVNALLNETFTDRVKYEFRQQVKKN